MGMCAVVDDEYLQYNKVEGKGREKVSTRIATVKLQRLMIDLGYNATSYEHFFYVNQFPFSTWAVRNLCLKDN